MKHLILLTAAVTNAPIILSADLIDGILPADGSGAELYLNRGLTADGPIRVNETLPEIASKLNLK